MSVTQQELAKARKAWQEACRKRDRLQSDLWHWQLAATNRHDEYAALVAAFNAELDADSQRHLDAQK